jgi:hypothetical protein
VRFIFLVEAGCNGSFVTPVRAPRGEINYEDELFALREGTQVDGLAVRQAVKCPVFIIHGLLFERSVFVIALRANHCGQEHEDESSEGDKFFHLFILRR